MSLFKIPKTFKLDGGDDFSELDMSDKELYEYYLEKIPYEKNLWVMNFTYLFTYSESLTRKIVWKLIDDMLCVFMITSEQEIGLVHLPLGDCNKKKLNTVLAKCFKIMDRQNYEDGKIPEVAYVSELQTSWIYLKRYFYIVDSCVGAEYHYDIKNLIQMEGKEYSYIRNKIRKFNKSYPNAKWREYKDKDWDQLMKGLS